VNGPFPSQTAQYALVQMLYWTGHCAVNVCGSLGILCSGYLLDMVDLPQMLRLGFCISAAGAQVRGRELYSKKSLKIGRIVRFQWLFVI